MELRVLCRCSHSCLGFRKESTNRQHQRAQKPLIPDPQRMRDINTELSVTFVKISGMLLPKET